MELAIAHSLKSLDDTNLDVSRHICKAHFSPIVPCYTPAVRLCYITMAKVNQPTFTFCLHKYDTNRLFYCKAPGRFAQKPVPPGTVRAKKIFERDVSSRDDSSIFPKIEFKVLFIKTYQLNAMDM